MFWSSRCILLVLTVAVLDAFTLHVSHAGPVLRLTPQPAPEYPLPAPVPVKDFQGAIPTGYGRLHFIAPGGMVRWEIWDKPRYIATAQAALRLIEERALGNRQCNDYFALMPKGKTFDQIWNGAGMMQIHISFSPGPSGTWRAAAASYTSPFEWTITESTVRLGPASVASALLLEATRTNSIGPQWTISFGAEAFCGLPSPVLNRDKIHRMGWAYWFSH